MKAKYMQGFMHNQKKIMYFIVFDYVSVKIKLIRRIFMENKISENNTKFLHSALTNKNLSVEDFENLTTDLLFDGENAKTWQFIILKSFEPEFSYLQPLAHHLLDHKYCIVDSTMLKYAALHGYQIEIGLDTMQKPLDQVNSFTKAAGFDERLIIVNKPAEAILKIANKIIKNSSDSDYQELMDFFKQSNIDTSSSKILFKPNTSKSLKI